MYNPTSTGECRNNMTTTTTFKGNSSIQSKAIYGFHHLSQRYMNFALPFIQQNLPHVCIILSDRSLESMLRAVYMKENQCLFPPHSLSLDDVVQFTAKESGPDLDTVMFINSIHFLADLEEISLIKQIHPAHFKKLMIRVDDILIRLSPKVTTHQSEQYHSIF